MSVVLLAKQQQTLEMPFFHPWWPCSIARPGSPFAIVEEEGSDATAGQRLGDGGGRKGSKSEDRVYKHSQYLLTELSRQGGVNPFFCVLLSFIRPSASPYF